MAQLVPARTRKTANDYLNLGDDEDCTNSLSPEELIASLAEDIQKSIEGTENSDQELQPITPEFSTKDALTALGIVSSLLEQSNSQDRIALTAISRKQLEFRKKKSDEMRQTTIDWHFMKK